MMWDENKIWKKEKKLSAFDRDYDSILALQQKFPALNLRKYLPLGVSYLGELITLPRSSVATNICISGQKQTLKSLMLYGLCDREYWYWNKRCWLCNDIISFLSYEHRFANNTPLFEKYLRMGGEQKRGLPLVFCYPSTNNLKFNTTPDFAFHKLKISIPFKEFLGDPQRFEILSGTELGRSETIFAKLKELFLNKSSAEILELCSGFMIEKEKTKKEQSIPKPSIRKIHDMMRKVISEEVFDIDQKGESTLIVKKGEEKIEADPISALLWAGVVPSLITNNLSSKLYMKEVFAYFAEKVFKEKEEGILNPYPVSIFCDEIHTLFEKGNIDIIRRIVREGSNLENGGIEFNYVAQNYSKVDNFIKSNTHYIITARNVGDEVKEIARDFNLERSEIKDMKELPRFHCYFLTKNEFRVFVPDKNKAYSTTYPIKGKILFPKSKHRSTV